MNKLQTFWHFLRSSLTNWHQNNEDTEILLENSFFKMQQELILIRSAIAGAIASLKRTERHYNQYQDDAQSWYHRVNLALNQHNSELAQLALSRCRYDLEIAQNLQKQINQQKDVIEKLKVDLSNLELKNNQLKRKKEMLLAQHKNALTFQEIEALKIELKQGHSARALEQMEERVWQLETQNSLLSKRPLDQVEIAFQKLENKDQNQWFNFEEKINLESNFADLKIKIETQLQQIRWELENLD